MLKMVFGVYINPDAVGWVTHEQVFRVEGKPDVVRRDTIEVFTNTGAMVVHQDLTAIDLVKVQEHNLYIEKALASLGYTEITKPTA